MSERVLPADVYDALELSALAFGGVGGGDYSEGVDHNPCCIHGHAASACGGMPWQWTFLNDMIGVSTVTSDRAVARINARLEAAYEDARVPFSDWCAELGVVRGV
jgi:hypothetical protein